jgi:hypothetical protein
MHVNTVHLMALSIIHAGLALHAIRSVFEIQQVFRSNAVAIPAKSQPSNWGQEMGVILLADQEGSLSHSDKLRNSINGNGTSQDFMSEAFKGD